jgi:hypothetical protein
VKTRHFRLYQPAAGRDWGCSSGSVHRSWPDMMRACVSLECQSSKQALCPAARGDRVRACQQVTTYVWEDERALQMHATPGTHACTLVRYGDAASPECATVGRRRMVSRGRRRPRPDQKAARPARVARHSLRARRIRRWWRANGTRCCSLQQTESIIYHIRSSRCSIGVSKANFC